MTDTYIVLTISIAGTLAQAIFWYWVNSLKNNSQENTKKLEEVKTELTNLKLEVSQNYQSKADAHRDMQTIMETLKEIKVEVKEVGNKLDKKADKT